MFSTKKISKFFFIASILLSSFCFASPENNHALKKIYVSPESIAYQNGHLIILNNEEPLYIKTLHQDESGLYYYTMSTYGSCPYGHPYSPDGGCYGADCPFN